MESSNISNTKIVSSFSWVLVERFGYSGINLLATIVLARLLTPYEFGLVGTVAVITSISNMIVESGMGAALVNKKNVTKLDCNTMFTFNFFMSIFLYALIFLLSPAIANYFDAPILENIIRVLSLTLVFNALTMVQRVILIKKLLFKQQSFISITALLVSVGVSILCALKGWGVWAIVIQLLLYSGVYSIIIFFVIRYIPRVQFSKKSFKDLVGFGGRIILSGMIQVGYNDIISSAISKVYTIQTTGLYTQSQKLISFPVFFFRSLFDSAAFPILSKTTNKGEFKLMCSQINRGIYFLAFPLLLIIPFNATSILHIVLGEQWIQANKIFTILSIGVIISLIDNSASNTLKSAGEAKVFLSIGISKAIIGLSILSVTFLFPIDFVLYGILFTNLITSFISIHYIDQLTLYKIKDQFKDILIPLSTAFIANLIAFLAFWYIDFKHIAINLSVYILIMLIVFVMQCLALNVKELKFIIHKIKKHPR
ncbi:hypothetical protein CGC58_04835 [Capnocytophaga stomatis]|uniref:Lipopolysaccharide biosynthesis protein n=1 Tax=Capnocytophaga stomatis TaxID=1848904 RepID=A0A250FVF4_9FLAO|nr:lipopolysaccharide biosynthesis protein [Capnocytophaga stomatis]ATA89100.1 hypothetical protein CGC58_04835 [Capnocytophaga stomatis]